MIITGLCFCEDKSVNGTGTRTISPCLNIVPILIINGIIPKIQASFWSKHQIVKWFWFFKNENGNLRPRFQKNLQLDFPFWIYLRLVFQGFLGVINCVIHRTPLEFLRITSAPLLLVGMIWSTSNGILKTTSGAWQHSQWWLARCATSE